jgi:hypothetical protein
VTKITPVLTGLLIAESGPGRRTRSGAILTAQMFASEAQCGIQRLARNGRLAT